MSRETPITVAHGDGIGPEIMAAVLEILEAAGASLDIETIEIGEQVYLHGISSGIDAGAWESIRRTRVFLKAPITTPQGGGYKSLNVTTRMALGLYANVRPAVAYHPHVQSKHPGMDLVVIRENEEDLYAGIEHRQTADVMQSLKLISRPGSERIIRFAFDYARRNGRSKVTAFAKDNIMKLSDGLFHDVFDEVAVDYPEIEDEYWIVDIGAAKLADTPGAFDVVVLPNLYGDILSDVAAQIAGSVGMAGAANIGVGAAMFEAIHGSAPRRAGQNLANPSGLLNAAVLMLVHIGQSEVAARVQNAWLRTLEDGRPHLRRSRSRTQPSQGWHPRIRTRRCRAPWARPANATRRGLRGRRRGSGGRFSHLTPRQTGQADRGSGRLPGLARPDAHGSGAAAADSSRRRPGPAHDQQPRRDRVARSPGQRAAGRSLARPFHGGRRWSGQSCRYCVAAGTDRGRRPGLHQDRELVHL